jgi:hypothetical protein
MSLDAFALLRLPHSAVSARSPEGVIALTDAVLLKTGASFAAEPAELAIGLRRLLGETLDAHDDTRGVYFLPAAAVEPARGAGSYAAVIEAIGEAGMWVAPVEEGTTARPTMVEALMARAMDGEEIDSRGPPGRDAGEPRAARGFVRGRWRRRRARGRRHEPGRADASGSRRAATRIPR